MTLNLVLLNELMDTLCTLKSYKVNILAEKSDSLRSKALIQCEHTTGEKYFVDIFANFFHNDILPDTEKKLNSEGTWVWGYYFYNEYYEKSHSGQGNFIETAGAIVQRLKIYG